MLNTLAVEPSGDDAAGGWTWAGIVPEAVRMVVPVRPVISAPKGKQG